jgi:chorismate lyase / 3-hydroxybenzoate synthase
MKKPRGLDVAYAHEDSVAACLAGHAGRVLGVVGFGARPVALRVALPWVHVPVLGAHDASFEVWTSGKPVTDCSAGNIKGATDGDVLFGSLQLEQHNGAGLDALTRQAYREMFAFLDQRGHRHLLRVWNYLPRINEPEQGLERYRRFNLGRHEAFAQSGRDITEENVPAASVLGCAAGPMVIYFLASHTPGKPIDNPRQTTAYRYPEQYGPRSPIFVRAMLASFPDRQCLMLSGTASIVGHETVHKGDVRQQAQETLRNIRTLLQQAYPDGPEDCRRGSIQLKAYVRHAQDIAPIQECVEQEFGPGQHTVYLQSDICRSDLLLEIEGVSFCEARR